MLLNCCGWTDERTDGWMGWYKYEWLIFRGCRHSTASQPKPSCTWEGCAISATNDDDDCQRTFWKLQAMYSWPPPSIHCTHWILHNGEYTDLKRYYIPKLYCPPHQRQTTYDKHDDDVNLWGSRRRLRSPLNGIPIKLTSNVNDEVTVQR